MAVRTNYPVDTDDTMYFDIQYSFMMMDEILDRAQAKWPGITMDKIRIEVEHRHVNAIGYDRYDPTDHITYLIVTRIV